MTDTTEYDPSVHLKPAEPVRLVDVAADVTDEPTESRELSRQSIRVELEDGTGFEVTVDNRDYVRWDMEASKRKWPSGADVPFLFQTFLAWSAAKRTGEFAHSFDVFQDRCVLAAMQEASPARPTR